MRYSEKFFGKPLEQVTFDDVVRFCDKEPEERLHLEFKSSTNKVKDDISKLTKDVCAFLNTEGGLLIYGAPRDKDNKPKGPFFFTKMIVNDLSKSLSDTLDPYHIDIRCHQIEIEGGNVILIDVPKSDELHQIVTKGFYIRVGEQSKPASTKLIESRLQKNLIPDLEIKYKITKIPFYNLLSFDKGFELKIEIHNHSTTTTKNLRILTTLFNISRSKIGDRFIQLSEKYKKAKVFTLDYPSGEISKGMKSYHNIEFSCSKTCLIHIKAFTQNNGHVEKLILFNPKHQKTIQEKDNEGLLYSRFEEVLNL
ncbi:AlbA family DNA-binding domain-containing protein [Aquimarina pacifica]|uniref:AlbA family DNA-binding domain-containing protein n=1 Tax=Aquimarina pacifica TaxID=1296415 RepID=UPI00046FF131|nr:ATP-binding protein [Aquimarina pacifica]